MNTQFDPSSLRRGALVAAAILAGMLAAPQAGAQVRDVTVVADGVPDTARIETVSYGDLNLASAEGRARLRYRVRGAVRHVCPAGQPADLVAARISGACQAAAWNGARPQIAAAIADTDRGFAMRGALSVAARP